MGGFEESENVKESHQNPLEQVQWNAKNNEHICKLLEKLKTLYVGKLHMSHRLSLIFAQKIKIRKSSQDLKKNDLKKNLPLKNHPSLALFFARFV